MFDGYPLKKYTWEDWVLLAATSSLALQFIGMFLVVNFGGLFFSDLSEETFLQITLNGTVYGAILSLPLTLLVVYWRKIPLFNRKGLSKEESFIIRGISKEDWKFLAKYIPSSYVIYIAGATVLAGIFGESEPVNQIAIESLFDYIPIWQMFLMVVVAAPIAEELLFRGLVLFSGGERETTWLRVIISALLFGIVHNPTDILSFYTYVGMGFIFAYASKRTGTIEVAMVYHFFNNLFGFIQILILRAIF